MAELDGRGALAVMHLTQPAVMVPDVNVRKFPVPAFEYFVETTRAFLNMVQNDTFYLLSQYQVGDSPCGRISLCSGRSL